MNKTSDDNQDSELEKFISEARVLIVDDNERNRMLIGAFLKAANINNQEFACDGVEGLDKVDEFNPDLIILDIMMPNMDGIEFMHHLRNSTDQATTPILVQTALNSADECNRIYASGASDMLTKPINAAEMITRVRTHLQLRHLANVYQNQLRIETELNAARRMQEALLPPSTLLEEVRVNSSLHLTSHFETCSELGGDLWGVHVLGEGKTGVFTIDFSGHGVGASLNTFRMHALMGYLRPNADDPAQYLAMLNNELKSLLQIGQFATMFYGVIDTQNDTLTYSAAAAPPPVVGSLNGAGMTYQDTRGIPLGMKKDATYETHTVDFPEGSFLFLYSDALIETPDDTGTDLNEDGVLEMLRSSLSQTDKTPAVEALTASFYDHAAVPLQDDLTFVLAAR